MRAMIPNTYIYCTLLLLAGFVRSAGTQRRRRTRIASRRRRRRLLLSKSDKAGATGGERLFGEDTLPRSRVKLSRWIFVIRQIRMIKILQNVRNCMRFFTDQRHLEKEFFALGIVSILIC